MAKLPVSVLLAIYNEEKNIERCLQSCCDLVDEVIVFHDGPCTDKTIEICKKYTDQIYIKEHAGESDPHRPALLRAAKHDWVLNLDADEFLSAGLRNNLAALINQNEYQGYQLAWPTLYRGKYYQAFWKTALANKKYFYFIACPHEYLKPINQEVKIKKVAYVLEHKPTYDNLTFKTFGKKWVSWAKLQAQYLVKDFKDIDKYNYPFTDWDKYTKLRIKYPILLGLPSTFIYQSYAMVKGFINGRRLFFLKAGILMLLYHFVLYYFVWKFKREKN